MAGGGSLRPPFLFPTVAPPVQELILGSLNAPESLWHRACGARSWLGTETQG